MKIPGIGHKIANEISSANPFKEVASIIKKCEQLKIDIIPFSDKRYPRRLTQQLDAPNILYFKGKGLLNPKRSVAIVGTRNATQYGKSITEKIVKDLSSLDVSIVSGLAYGITYKPIKHV